MKSWHIGLIVVLFLAYLAGAKWGSFGQSLLAKVGM